MFCFFSLNFICGITGLFLCRWCDYARILNWPSRTALHTSWTSYPTPTSIFAPSCHATKERWRLWATTSISVSSWRTWRRRRSRRSVCSRKAKNACMKKTRSQGEPGCILFRHHTIRHDGTSLHLIYIYIKNTPFRSSTHTLLVSCSLLAKWYLHKVWNWGVCKSETSVRSLVVTLVFSTQPITVNVVGVCWCFNGSCVKCILPLSLFYFWNRVSSGGIKTT